MVETRPSIAVVGLGYVGLPVALAMARRFEVVGFDIDHKRVEALRRGEDETGEVTAEMLSGSDLRLSSQAREIAAANLYIVAVPTPIDRERRPDLTALLAATRTVAGVLSRGDVVVYESTGYPGMTEEVCGPLLAEVSGLVRGEAFWLGYSPERINPGDRAHRLESVVKVVAGEDDRTLTRVAEVYAAVIPAGVHRAPSIRVAEAAKVIENIQRDLNIALMNELAILFDRLDLRTREVLEVARTKWNFLPFHPGLVGGHCVGVDPYYLTALAETRGYSPEVILAGRRINEGMGAFIAQRLVKLLRAQDATLSSARIGVLGLAFKANVRDLRNSKVVDLIEELREFGVSPWVHDPLACPRSAKATYNLTLSPWDALQEMDALVLAVPHQSLLDMGTTRLLSPLRDGGVLIDIQSALDPTALGRDLVYWSL